MGGSHRNASGERRHPGVFVSVILAAAAFAWTWVCGHRGFFGFDQSIVFDGGYRVARGQIPYRDFLIPTGPVACWLQGLAFHAAGADYAVYVGLAALLAAIGVVVTVAWMRLLAPGRPLVAIGAAAAIGVWLMAPFGTPWFETIAHLLLLLMLWGLARGGGLSLFLAGTMAAAAYLTKQTVGIEALVLAGCVWVAGLGREAQDRAPERRGSQDTGLRRESQEARPRRRWARAAGSFPARPFAAGILVAGALFTVWLFLFSDPSAFWSCTVRLPAALARTRLHPDGILHKLGALIVRDRWLWPLHLVTAGGMIVGAWHLLGRRYAPEAPARAGLLVGLGLAAYFEMAVTENHAAIAVPFGGISLLVTLVVMDGASRRFRPSAPPAGRSTRMRPVAVTLLWLLLILTGVRTAWTRQVQDPLAGSRMSHPLRIEGMRYLRWTAEPIGTEYPRREDFIRLVDFLRESHERFFVWPDNTILYGLCDVPSPQPLLWFHRGLTYPTTGDPQLQARILESLQRHELHYIVYETFSWHGTAERLADFPRLRAWMDRSFAERRRIGPFRILERREGAPSLDETEG